MSVWIQNLRSALQDKPVLILYGNVRDRYIDPAGRVYLNLNDLLAQVTQEIGLSFGERMIYDPVGQERRTRLTAASSPPATPVPAPTNRGADDELSGTQPRAQSTGQQVPPARIFAIWVEQAMEPTTNRLFVLYYLDKVIAYKSGYQDDEKEILLRLEKIIENITPNHRLIMVALQDTQLPLELYTHAPKVRVLPIPLPDKTDRLAYLSHRLGANYTHRELAADLTDGLYLHDLDAIARELKDHVEADSREVRRLVNRYRIGEQEDHWASLSITRLAQGEDWFTNQEGVKGQQEAIERVLDILVLARAGLTGMAGGTAAKPKGVLFFAGPTGVGKTFVAKKLAKFLFSTEEAFIRFDMSEFKEEHTVSKLIGSPPGYVGYERGGMLTNAVREKPFAVLLFDEIEKANPKIFDIFLQLLDEGRLTDSRGQTVFFTETMIIFTSNIGARALDSRGNPIAEQSTLDRLLAVEATDNEQQQRLREHFRRAVENFFLYEIARPELLNRIGNNIIPFNYIHGVQVQQNIIRSHLQRIAGEFADKYRRQNYRVQVSDGVVDLLVARYGARISRFGGRGITNAINDEVMLPLARAVLEAEYENVANRQFHLELSGPDGTIEVKVTA
jgi:ATP-dependent Clp protease ATP-binding subunit ClpA